MWLCLITVNLAPDFEGDSFKFRSGCIQSGQIHVFGMHGSGGRVCACLRESLFWQPNFKKPLCILPVA